MVRPIRTVFPIASLADEFRGGEPLLNASEHHPRQQVWAPSGRESHQPSNAGNMMVPNPQSLRAFV